MSEGELEKHCSECHYSWSLGNTCPECGTSVEFQRRKRRNWLIWPIGILCFIILAMSGVYITKVICTPVEASSKSLVVVFGYSPSLVGVRSELQARAIVDPLMRKCVVDNLRPIFRNALNGDQDSVGLIQIVCAYQDVPAKSIRDVLSEMEMSLPDSEVNESLARIREIVKNKEASEEAMNYWKSRSE